MQGDPDAMLAVVSRMEQAVELKLCKGYHRGDLQHVLAYAAELLLSQGRRDEAMAVLHTKVSRGLTVLPSTMDRLVVDTDWAGGQGSALLDEFSPMSLRKGVNPRASAHTAMDPQVKVCLSDALAVSALRLARGLHRPADEESPQSLTIVVLDDEGRVVGTLHPTDPALQAQNLGPATLVTEVMRTPAVAIDAGAPLRFTLGFRV